MAGGINTEPIWKSVALNWPISPTDENSRRVPSKPGRVPCQMVVWATVKFTVGGVVLKSTLGSPKDPVMTFDGGGEAGVVDSCPQQLSDWTASWPVRASQ